MKNWILTLTVLLTLGGCIGTDLVDDPIVAERLVIFPDRIALLVDNTTQATATFYNQYGVEEKVTISWSTQPTSIATVDQDGLVSAAAPGQALLIAAYGALKDTVRIAVVLNENAAASIDISVPKTSLALGEKTTFTAVVKNINDQPMTSSTIDWFSTNESVLTIDANGLATGAGIGAATVYAIADGVYSNEIEMSVGQIRIGTFVSANGYNTSGMATLQVVNGELILQLGENFMTDFALGTFVYLANNNTSGTAIRSEGVELGEIKTNGAHTFNVTQKFPAVTLSQYKYVIILCKPASIPFGYAQLN